MLDHKFNLNHKLRLVQQFDHSMNQMSQLVLNHKQLVLNHKQLALNHKQLSHLTSHYLNTNMAHLVKLMDRS